MQFQIDSQYFNYAFILQLQVFLIFLCINIYKMTLCKYWKNKNEHYNFATRKHD